MLDKVKNLLPMLVDKIKAGLSNTPKPVVWIAFVYSAVVGIALSLFVALFLFDYQKGAVKSMDFLKFIDLIIGGAFVSFATFIVGLCIDSNGDGVPDKYDKEE